jgi:hypothetical protein
MHSALQLITKVPKEQNALTHRYQHLNGIFIMLGRKLERGERYIDSVYCYSLKLQNCKGQGLVR